MSFSKRLINWYHIHKRDLPWRNTTDPFHIWLSEVILQQTRVQQGLPYYNRFIKAFPGVEDLASAPQEKVLKLWQGLGYYSRARNLHTAAQQVAAAGAFPDNYKDLLKLKGVGEYTAAAIASFAYHEPVAVVDGNVYRVLARIYGISLPINETAGIKEFKKLANQLLDAQNPAVHNQAIMELGALQCVPKNPDCAVCPFQSDCVAFNDSRIAELPVKLKKTKVKNLFHHYIVLQTSDHKTMVQQRPQSGIWAGLFEFPYIESDGPLLPSELIVHDGMKELLELRFRESGITTTQLPISSYNQEPIIHKLSHRKIHAYFWILEMDLKNEAVTTIQEAYKKPLPILIHRFMSSHWNSYL